MDGLVMRRALAGLALLGLTVGMALAQSFDDPTRPPAALPTPRRCGLHSRSCSQC
jgi:hypothetical protein